MGQKPGTLTKLAGIAGIYNCSSPQLVYIHIYIYIYVLIGLEPSPKKTWQCPSSRLYVSARKISLLLVGS